MKILIIDLTFSECTYFITILTLQLKNHSLAMKWLQGSWDFNQVTVKVVFYTAAAPQSTNNTNFHRSWLKDPKRKHGWSPMSALQL